MASEPALIHILWYPNSDINQSADLYSSTLCDAESLPLSFSHKFCPSFHLLSFSLIRCYV